MPKSEKQIVQDIVGFLNGLERCRAVKNHGSVYSVAGRPDIDACFRGRHLALEVKRPGARPALPKGEAMRIDNALHRAWISKGATRKQVHELERWRKAGALADVVTSVEEVRTMIEALE